MKTLIRDLDSGLLYREPGRWVGSWMEATGFHDVTSAWDQGKALKKSNLEVFVVDERGRPSSGYKIPAEVPIEGK